MSIPARTSIGGLVKIRNLRILIRLIVQSTLGRLFILVILARIGGVVSLLILPRVRVPSVEHISAGITSPYSLSILAGGDIPISRGLLVSQVGLFGPLIIGSLKPLLSQVNLPAQDLP